LWVYLFATGFASEQGSQEARAEPRQRLRKVSGTLEVAFDRPLERESGNLVAGATDVARAPGPYQAKEQHAKEAQHAKEQHAKGLDRESASLGLGKLFLGGTGLRKVFLWGGGGGLFSRRRRMSTLSLLAGHRTDR
jgi:hypothetical protein